MSLVGFVDLYEQLEVDQRIHEFTVASQEFAATSLLAQNEMSGLIVEHAEAFLSQFLGDSDRQLSQFRPIKQSTDRHGFSVLPLHPCEHTDVLPVDIQFHQGA